MLPSGAFAAGASMKFSPVTDTRAVGEVFSIGIYASSPDQALNAVSGEISFPADKLEVVALAEKDSVISFWIRQPYYLNEGGIIMYEGIILNPGYIGSSGKF